VRVFPDTNVLASAFGTRGLCADVLRLILGEHELLTGEMVIEELRYVLAKKFKVPPDTWNDIESFLRGYHVEPKPQELPKLKLRDRNDRVVIGSALSSKAEILVTGDQEILALEARPKALRILSPREFWNLAAGRKKSEK
jgi:putative PIN family toxin of toxin-antitoxin system